MSMGIGAMLHMLGGGSPQDPAKYYGKMITAATEDRDELLLAFDDGTGIRVFDNGQSCCESRYMRTDDNLDVLVGKVLVGIEVNQARTAEDIPDQDQYSDVHDVVFLDVKTREDGVAVTFSFHVEHNGYYGGFGLCVAEVAST